MRATIPRSARPTSGPIPVGRSTCRAPADDPLSGSAIGLRCRAPLSGSAVTVGGRYYGWDRGRKLSIDGWRLSAGWYPDPEEPATERWWNGSQWTSHSRQVLLLTDDVGPEGESPRAWSATDAPLATLLDPDRLDPEPAGTAMFGAAVQRPVAPTPLVIPAGWYPEPSGVPAQRWWDGTGWTAHTAPIAAYAPVNGPYAGQDRGQPQIHVPYGHTTVVMVAPRKSVGVALVLTFFFGPFGMFYSTVSGALIMLGILVFGGFIAGVVTLGLAWLVWWPMVWLASMIWGGVAAGNQPPLPVVSSYR